LDFAGFSTTGEDILAGNDKSALNGTALGALKVPVRGLGR
jgi:hypothetical protein